MSHSEFMSFIVKLVLLNSELRVGTGNTTIWMEKGRFASHRSSLKGGLSPPALRIDCIYPESSCEGGPVRSFREPAQLMNCLGERNGRMEGSAGGGELTDVEAWLKGVSIVGLPRNLMPVPDTGKPSSKTGAPAQRLHEVLETAGFPKNTRAPPRMLLFCLCFGLCVFC